MAPDQAVRVNVYMPEDIHRLYLRVKRIVDSRVPEEMSDSQAMRMAIRAWAKQEKVK